MSEMLRKKIIIKKKKQSRVHRLSIFPVPWFMCLLLFCVSLCKFFSLQCDWKIFVKWDFSIFLIEEKKWREIFRPAYKDNFLLL